jgi:hypothetical protein
MHSVYSVRAAAAIIRRGSTHTRRRAGLAFGAEDRLVSTGSFPGVEKVDKKQLAAILHDSNLRDPKDLDPSTPGLRVKEVERSAAPEPAVSTVPPAKNDEPVEPGDQAEDSEPAAEPAEASSAKKPARRGRRSSKE